MQSLNTQILQSLPAVQRQLVRVSDIGGGDGDRAIRITDFLHAKFQNRFELDYVEQSALYVKQFERRQPGGCRKTRVLRGLFERVELPQNHYDLVLVIHSIFALETGAAIDKLLALRKQNGHVVVVANARNSFLGGLKQLLDDGFDDKRYEIDDFQRSLRALMVTCDTHSIITRWAVEERHRERDIDLILNWMSLGRIRHFSRARQRQVVSYVADLGQREGKRILFAEEEVVLVVPSGPYG